MSRLLSSVFASSASRSSSNSIKANEPYLDSRTGERRRGGEDAKGRQAGRRLHVVHRRARRRGERWTGEG